MDSQEKKFWMEVYVASIRAGVSFDARTAADNAVRRLRKSDVELKE